MSKHKQICKSCGEFKNHHAKGMCQKCYSAYRRKFGTKRICKDCGNICVIIARGLCEQCYKKQWYASNPNYIKEYQVKNAEKLRIGAINWRERHPGYRSKEYVRRRNRAGKPSMAENKTCSMFLGVHVAEQVLSKVFKDVKQMPSNNPGYDFTCNKGMKIDVKSSCIRKYTKTPNWTFAIDKNKTADYFLCIAFDNRKNLNPLHLWLIPNEILNTNRIAGIAESTLSKWNEYALPIDKVTTCCNTLR